MLKHMLIGLVALALVACGSPGTGLGSIPTAPVELANRTAVDEQVAVGIENGYKAFRLAVELGVDTGVIKGDRAVRAKAADNRAYAALLVFRQAYKTANATDFLTAARSANIAVEQAIAVAKEK
jgi:hypothetical protein